MTRLFVEQMKKRGAGIIVNFSSGADMAPSPFVSAYSASKVIKSK